MNSTYQEQNPVKEEKKPMQIDLTKVREALNRAAPGYNTNKDQDA
jgi:hypothetical protein